MTRLVSALVDGWRLMRARPIGNALAIGVLAAGLTAYVSITALNAVIFAEPPTAIDHENTYRVGFATTGAQMPLAGGEQLDVLDLRAADPHLAGTVAFRWSDLNLAGDSSDGATRVAGLLVDGDLFGTLRWPMLHGRGFVADDFKADADGVVVLGERLWRSRYAADPGIVGRAVRVDGQRATVVGVLPAQRSFPFQQQLYLSVSLAGRAELRSTTWQTVLALPDVQARAAVERSLAALQVERETRGGEDARRSPLRLQSLSSEVDPSTQLLGIVLQGIATLLLLLAATNAGGLLLVQWLGRRRELATRRALGAGTGRTLAALAVQGLLLATAALVVGLFLTGRIVERLNNYLWSTDNGMPLYFAVELSQLVLAMTAAGTVLLLLALLWPTARRLRRGDLAQDLRSGARSIGGNVSRFGRGLFGLQCLLAMVAVLVAVQAAQGARDALRRPLGIDADRVLTAGFGSSDAAAGQRFAERLRQALEGQAGVEAVSIGGALPVAVVSERTVRVGENSLSAEVAPVDGQFAQVFGIGLRGGRWLTDADLASQADPDARVAVLDPAAAQALFGDADPIGRRIEVGFGGEFRAHTVVGLSQPVRMVTRGGADRASIFVPAGAPIPYERSLAVRTRGPAEAFAPQLQAIARGIDPDIALVDLSTFEQLRWRANGWSRFVLGLFAPLGLLAIVLAASGLGALLGSLVAQRVREIGVRRALGAHGGRLARGLFGGLLLWGGLGAGIGLVLALVGTRGMSQALYGETGLGVPALLAALAVMAVTLVVAAAGPLRRALRVPPTVALRAE
jgi:predicted permease